MTMIPRTSQLALPPQISDNLAPTDAVLVRRAILGDAAAFELIMRRYNQRLYRLSRGILRNATEAEDAVQETYLRAYEKLGDFIGPNGFASWIGRIAINEALGRVRKSGRVISLDDYVGANERVATHPIDSIGTAMPDPERLAASSELRHMLERAIDALPDDFRAVFILRAVEGMNTAETSGCLGIRPQTVKTRFHRARRLLQDDLGEKFDALMPSTFSFGGDHCDRITTRVMTLLAHTIAAKATKLPD
jgi:RNA polymerase sigma-70 factor (ECF subfamily)